MKFNIKKLLYLSLMTGVAFSVACTNDDDLASDSSGDDTVEYPDYYYTGGELATSKVWGSKCFEQATESIVKAGLSTEFLYGEGLFEDSFISEINTVQSDMRGRGPLYIRQSCIHCHPGYGHGKRLGDLGSDVVGFNTTTRETGNGYLLVVYGPGADGAFGGDEAITSGITGSSYQTPNAEDDFYVSELTGMPQTQAEAPFKAPIDEDQITITWHEYTDEWDNKYADGTSYQLIYPEVSIPDAAFAYKNDNITGDAYKVKLEATIGIYGSCLIDAISEADIDAEYESQSGEMWGGRRGAYKAQPDGTTRKGRFTYALSRGTLQYGAGANAMWNITNVTIEGSQPEHRANYMTTFYADAAANDQEVLNGLTGSYYDFLIGDNDDETKIKVYNYLMYNSTFGEYRYSSYTEANNEYQKDAELSQDDYKNFMIWHRGLAVPAARNTGTEEFARGMELFEEMSCTACHRPSWTTGPDAYVGDSDMAGELPTYSYQKIWPYSDFLQHNLGMVNNIRTGWCRTTPLWGRYLNLIANGESSHLHDMRARNYEEAIMWHKGQGKYSSDQFRELSAEDRAAVVKFLQSI